MQAGRRSGIYAEEGEVDLFLSCYATPLQQGGRDEKLAVAVSFEAGGVQRASDGSSGKRYNANGGTSPCNLDGASDSGGKRKMRLNRPQVSLRNHPSAETTPNPTGIW